MSKFDVIVVGSGPGGSSAAMNLKKAGKSVAVIDYQFGGTCALKGCTPKKVMETVSSLYWAKKNLEGIGFNSLSQSVNWSELVTHQKHFTELVPKNTIEKFNREGIKCINGKASFVNSNSLVVNDKIYSASKIILATGATEKPLNFNGADFLSTSFDFFRLEQLPEHVTFIGGGYIAFELSHIAAACGAKVTIINDTAEFLTQFNPDFAHKMLHATLDKGINIILNAQIKSIEKGKSYIINYLISGESASKKMTSDLVIHSAGRIPAVETLKVENANLQLTKNKGIKTNTQLEAISNKNIYALGDVTGELPFTEIANYDAKIVVNNILHPKNKKRVNYKGMPMVLYCYPKMARVGITEKELKAKKTKYTVHRSDFENYLLQRSSNNTYAMYSVYVSTSNKILGCEIIGLKADDMINIFAMAIQTNLSYHQLNQLLLAYPTATHDAKGFD